MTDQPTPEIGPYESLIKTHWIPLNNAGNWSLISEGGGMLGGVGWLALLPSFQKSAGWTTLLKHISVSHVINFPALKIFRKNDISKNMPLCPSEKRPKEFPTTLTPMICH